MTKWIEYTGSDEQIEEINNSKCFLLKRKDGAISFVLYPPYHPNNMDSETTIEYLIGSHHPYADLIKIWADTGFISSGTAKLLQKTLTEHINHWEE